MLVLELRKSKSKNKRYKFIYELMYDGVVLYTRRSVVDYAGAIVERQEGKYICKQFFKSPAIAILVSARQKIIALTFDSLKAIKLGATGY